MDRVILGDRLVYPEWDRLFTVRAGQIGGLCRDETNLTITGSTLHEYDARHKTPNRDPGSCSFSAVSGPRRCGTQRTRAPGAEQEYPRFLGWELTFAEVHGPGAGTEGPGTCSRNCGSESVSRGI